MFPDVPLRVAENSVQWDDHHADLPGDVRLPSGLQRAAAGREDHHLMGTLPEVNGFEMVEVNVILSCFQIPNVQYRI